MEILSSIYSAIVYHSFPVPPESGGLLGGDGRKITVYCRDKGVSDNGFIYRPDTRFLNCVLRKWGGDGLAFMGLYHTHAPGGEQLSDADKKYIAAIMKAVRLPELYFPVIIPAISMTVFKADYHNGQLSLTNERVEIID